MSMVVLNHVINNFLIFLRKIYCLNNMKFERMKVVNFLIENLSHESLFHCSTAINELFNEKTSFINKKRIFLFYFQAVQGGLFFSFVCVFLILFSLK